VTVIQVLCDNIHIYNSVFFVFFPNTSVSGLILCSCVDNF